MTRQRLLGLAKLLGFLLALDAFFVAVHLLGSFKDIGSGYGEALMAGLVGRPVLGVLVGVLVTSIVQSSSTTTSLVVGLAAAGVFGDDPDAALRTAVPVIMGANIGTTVTNTIVSFGHIDRKSEFRSAFAAATVHDMFNLLAVVLLLPIQVATNFIGRLSRFVAEVLCGSGGLRFASPLRVVIDPQTAAIDRAFALRPVTDLVVALTLAVAVLWALGLFEGRLRARKNPTLVGAGLAVLAASLVATLRSHHELLFEQHTALFLAGLMLLVGALYSIVRIMRTVVLDRATRIFQDHLFRTTWRALAVGLVMTALVQSSSVTTSIVVPLAGAGMLTLGQVYPYSLGANLGTTVTAMLAALSLAEPLALAVALAHLLFNLLGIAVFLPLRRVPIRLAEALAAGAVRSRLVPVAYVLGMYLGLPVLLVWLLAELD